MMIWLFYNALVPLLPVLFVWGISWLVSDSGKTKKICEIIRDGQVLFYCTATSSVAMGDLKKVPQSFDTSPWLAGFLFILVLSTGAFAIAAHNRDAPKEDKFCLVSVAMAIATILVVVTFRDKAGLL
jgi:hypothetical protein